MCLMKQISILLSGCFSTVTLSTLMCLSFTSWYQNFELDEEESGFSSSCMMLPQPRFTV